MLTEVELIEVGRNLLREISRSGQAQASVKPNRMANFAQYPVVHGLSAHALRLGAVVLDLYERGLYAESLPLIRSAYECAITALWAADSREAIGGLMAEEDRQREALARAMQSASSVFADRPVEVASHTPVDVDAPTRSQSRHFEQRCKALAPAGADAYVLYRAMSGFCHPSAALADLYVEENSASEIGVRLLNDPNRHAAEVSLNWLFLAVASLVWAARAADVMLQDHPNRNYLRAVASELQIADVLNLTPTARAAEAQKDQARRRANWKGPRKRGT